MRIYTKHFPSEETKEKMRQSHLGRKYKPMSEIGKHNLSVALKGRKLSEEHKRKLAENGFQKGENNPAKRPEIRKKISEKAKGRMPWSYGKHLSEKTRRKIGESHRGSKSVNWKGGIEPENKRIRKSIEFRLWREAVFARDNWTCQKCGKRGIKLHPHHIKAFAKFPEFRFANDNAITLSENCHKLIHKKHVRAN